MASQQSDEKAIFGVACDIADEAAREDYLRQACEGAPELLVRVRRLLELHLQSSSFLRSPAAELLAPSLVANDSSPSESHSAALANGNEVGAQIGPYRLYEQIGEGGMGVVYVARQKTPVRRKVALKIIRPGLAGREVMKRFEAERQALALMDHPHIATMLDAGTTPSGQPYFVMELVKGLPITDHCDAQRLEMRDRLALFLQVCQAVQHAHQKGVIHRDLKPSNVIVAVHDTTPVVKVIDFGVAKAIGPSLTDQTLYTGFNQVVGTPLYMSPEQAGQSSLDIDTRSDVYSLGVLLYQLLTGGLPFDGDALKSKGYDEIRRLIREVDPPRPSARVSTLEAAELSTVCEQRRTHPQRLGRQLRGELDWIVMKALEKDRNRRYESASALAKDVERYLRDEPIEAGPPSVLYRLRKSARRHKVVLASTAAVALALLAGLGASLWQAEQARRAENDADRKRQDAEQNLELARQAIDRLMDHMGDKSLPPSPQFDDVRKAVAAESVRFYEKLLNREGESPAVRLSLARVWQRIAEVEYDLARYEQAMQAYEKSFHLLEALIAEHPAEPSYMRELAAGKETLANGEIHLRKNRSQGAIYLRDALGLRRALARVEPHESEHRYFAWKDEVELYRIEGPGENEPWLRRRLEAARAFLAERASDAERRRTVVAYLLQLAAYLRSHGGPGEEIARLYDEAIAVLDQTPPSEANDRQWDIFRGWVLEGKATYLKDTGDLEEAERVMRQSVAICDDLSRRLQLGHRDEAVRALSRITLGEMIELQQRHSEAEQLYRAALAGLPKADWGQRWNAAMHLAAVQVRQGKSAEAADTLSTAIAASSDKLRQDPSNGEAAWNLLVSELSRAEASGEECSSGSAAAEKLRISHFFKPRQDPLQAIVAHVFSATRYRPAPFPRAVVAAAAFAAEVDPSQAGFHRTLGIARYRAQDYAGAAESLRRSLAIESKENANGMLFLAMSLHHLGQADEARLWLHQACAELDQAEQPFRSLLELRDEAKELIEP